MRWKSIPTFSNRFVIILPSVIAAAVCGTNFGCHSSSQRSNTGVGIDDQGPPALDENSLDIESIFVVRNNRLHVRDERVQEDTERGARLVREADDLVRRNQFKDALHILATAATDLPHSSNIYERMGRIFIFRGQVEMAVFALRAAVEEDSENIIARVLFAESLMSQGRMSEAIVEWNQLLESGNPVGETHQQLATCHYHRGEYEVAWTHVRLAENYGKVVPPHFRAMLLDRLPDSRSNDLE